MKRSPSLKRARATRPEPTRRRDERPRKPHRDAPRKRPEAHEPEAFLGLVELYGKRVLVRILHKEFNRLAVEIFPRRGEHFDEGDVVRIKLTAPAHRGPSTAECLENMGPHPIGLESQIAILNHGLRVEFPPDVMDEAETLKAYRFASSDGREDWRNLPFVTIDGADARDFDDAVFAEPVDTGFRILVAIADVAHYVKVGSPLDMEARERGNSTYFPDRVVPMLPERLSNDLCSLRPQVDRPVFAMELWMDGKGKLMKRRALRAVIHSAARLTYERVQAVLDGGKDGGLSADVLGNLKALHAAWEVLDAHRVRRGALDLNIPETMMEMGEDGRVKGVKVRERLVSHRLIEEMMILANVAAADLLTSSGKGAKGTGLYRIHDRPNAMKLETLAAALAPLGFRVPAAAETSPKAWAPLVEQLEEHPAGSQLMRSVLQAQQQARYETANIGHYGLALPLYSHFTSPIRRYADLVTHRALLATLGLDHDDPRPPTLEHTKAIAEHINLTERASQQAEWEARDRMVCRHFADCVGDDFAALVTSAQSFGCFVTIEGLAEGLVPARFLEPFWRYVPRLQQWKAPRTGQIMGLGTRLMVRLEQADFVSGRLTFSPARAVDSSKPVRQKKASYPRKRVR